MIILIIINFVISIAAIILFFFLYLKMNNVQSLEQEYRSLLKEAEDSINSFVFELKEDNEKLMERLTNISSLQTMENNSEDTKKEPSFSYVEELNNNDIKEILQHTVLQSEKENVQPPKSLYEQALDLKNKGATIEEIAKKLSKGKTEIELLLKFRQN